MEIDYIPGVISPSDLQFKRYILDYCIGSVHFVDRNQNNQQWGIDASQAEFEIGLREIFHGDSQKAVREYYRLVCEMVQKSAPPIIGHLDIIKKFNDDEQYFSEQEQWYKEAVIETLNVIANSKCIVEVNTSGLKKSSSKQTYPAPWILRECLDRKIPICINADAHKPEQLMQGFPETITLLKDIGYTEHKVLGLNRWQEKPL